MIDIGEDWNGPTRERSWGSENGPMYRPFLSSISTIFLNSSMCVRIDCLLGGGLGMRKCGEIYKETITKTSRDINEMKENVGFLKCLLPGIRFVWCQGGEGSLCEDSAGLHGIWSHIWNRCEGGSEIHHIHWLSAIWHKVVFLFWNKGQC